MGSLGKYTCVTVTSGVSLEQIQYFVCAWTKERKRLRTRPFAARRDRRIHALSLARSGCGASTIALPW